MRYSCRHFAGTAAFGWITSLLQQPHFPSSSSSTTLLLSTTTSSSSSSSSSFVAATSKTRSMMMNLSSTGITSTTTTARTSSMSNCNVAAVCDAFAAKKYQHLYPPLAPAEHPLFSIQQALQNSWLEQLSPETPEHVEKARQVEGLPPTDDNRRKRPVFNGHYVLVQPTKLRQTQLLLWSSSVAHDLLNLSDDQMNSDAMLQWLSGNHQDVATATSTTTSTTSTTTLIGPTWATPYALSIMGERYTSNCPYGTGNGYGDGRAIILGEWNDWEVQGKGMGRTPFSRGADGRAVLRSSIREFLASEAMHHLRVPTTRALSLVVSAVDTVHRPWYSEAVDNNSNNNNNNNKKNPLFSSSSYSNTLPTSVDDPRLAKYSLEQRRQILRQVRQQKSDPDRMVQEPCAITCRVSRSFLRVGHVDLFARRAMKKHQSIVAWKQQQQQQIRNDDSDSDDDDDDVEDKSPRENGSASSKTNRNHRGAVDIRSTLEWKELEEIIWHACYREYRNDAYTPFQASDNLAGAADVLLRKSAETIATMVAHWIRVGFAQGNFNADNCLVGGYTMDYGPFGYLEEYQPLFAKWTGSGQHFGFMNQINAGYVNYKVLVESVLPVLALAKKGDDFTVEYMEEIGSEYMNAAKDIFQSKLDETFRIKLGLLSDDTAGDDLWEDLEPMMRSDRVDWTLFWRQLSYLSRDLPSFETEEEEEDENANVGDLLLSKLEGGGGGSNKQSSSSPFYEPLSEQQRVKWSDWLTRWRQALNNKIDGDNNNHDNIIYERMRLVNPKYVLREWMLVDAYTAANNGEYELLHELNQLIQHPYEEGSVEEEQRFYRRAPEEALVQGGTAFMSCSS